MRILKISVGGQNDDLYIHVLLIDKLCNLQTGHQRHTDIRDYDIRRSSLYFLQQ